MILLTRVDHRLLHGQVAFSWTQNLGADCILIANDDVPKNELRKTTIKLAKPQGVKLVIKSIDDAIQSLNSGVTDKYKLFIVVESIEDAYKLSKNYDKILQINLGGTKASEEKENISKAVNVTEKDKNLLKELVNDGVEVEIRQVPVDKKNINPGCNLIMKEMLKRLAGMNYYYRYYPIEYFFESLQKNNLKYFELWTCTHHFEITDLKFEETKKIKKLMKIFDTSIICLTPEQSNPKPYNLAASDIYLKTKAKNYFMNAIKAASELECPYVSMNSGWDFYSENTNEAWKRSVYMMQELAEFAKSQNVSIVFEALQPNESHLVNSINDIALYMESVNQDNVFVNIDFGAMARSNETIDQYFKTFGNKIKHCHFVDGSPTGHLAWGEGNRDAKADITDLKNNNYQGFLTFEFANSKYFQQPFEVDRQAIKYLKNLSY